MSFLSETEMLATAEEAPGRRNWSKCKVVADVTSTLAHLFPDGCVTQVALRKLIELGEHAVLPAIASRIHDLLKLQIRGTPVQEEIDAQLTLSLLPLSMQERLWSRIRMRPEHLLSTNQVMDIGHIVRDIMLLKTRNEVLFKLYQYTMPFIKHNRLNFPPMTCMPRVVLMHLMQLIALSCLGLYSQHHKTPTLHIRKQLFRFLTNLLTLGSLRDIYSFCHHHMYLLRLALMEHFVYFTSTCMAKEMPMLLKCSGTFYDHDRTQRMVQYITDQFRTVSLQTDSLDWSLVESKAQLCVERCNRTCKSQNLHIKKKQPAVSQYLSVSLLIEAVKQQRSDGIHLPLIATHSSMLSAAMHWSLSRAVCKYPLPLHFQNAQFVHMERMASQVNHSTIVARSKLHFCLRCNQRQPNANDDMRVQYPGKPICRHCLSSDYVCVGDTLGHLLGVYDNYYYFCTFCTRVHRWRGSGIEFTQCSFKDDSKNCRRKCAVCVRTMQLQNFSVLDSRLGVVHKVPLCYRHCLPPTLMQSVHNVKALKTLIQHLAQT